MRRASVIKSEDSAVTKVYVRSDSSEELIFWYKSLLKMIADTKEKEKEIKRRNKMLVSLTFLTSGCTKLRPGNHVPKAVLVFSSHCVF